MARIRVIVPLLWILVVASSGCFGRDAGAPDNGGDVPVPPPEVVTQDSFTQSFTQSFTAGSCREVTILARVPFDHAQYFLPEGYVAADVSGLLGSPVPAGDAGVLLTNAICEESSLVEGRFAEGAIGILVEAPAFPGVDDAAYNFYEPALVMENGSLRDDLLALGWNLIGSDVESELTGLPVPLGGGTVFDGEVLHYTALVQAAVPGPTLSGVFRWWHSLPHGTGLLDYEFTTTGFVATPQCLVDGFAARVSGIADCRTDGGLVIVATDFQIDVTLAYFADTWVAPAQ